MDGVATVGVRPMNQQAKLSLLRQILTVLGGLFAGYGIGNVEQWGYIVDDIAVTIPALISLGSIVWSIWAHYRQVKVPEQTRVASAEGPMPAVVAVKLGTLEAKS